MVMALETAPNAEGGVNAVSSNVFYLKADSVKFDDGFVPLEEKGKMVGVMGRAKHLGTAKFEPKLSIKGISPRPADLALLLFAWSGDCTTTPGDASAVHDPDAVDVPVGAYRHVFAFADDTPQTVQVICKDAGGKWWELTGGGIENITFTFDNGVLGCDLDIIGLFGGEIADPSLTPVYDAATPFRQGDMTLAWLTGSAQTKAFDFALKAGLETDKGFSVISDYPDVIQFANDEESLPDIAGSITKRTLDADDIAALHAGTQFAAEIKLTHREHVQRSAVAVTSSSVADASVITCGADHHLPTGMSTVVIAGHTGSTPSLNGTHVATKIDATTFSIPVTASVGGTGGTVISDTAYHSKAWFEMPGCQHVSMDPDDIKNVRRREAKWGWQARVDETTDSLATITVVNGTAAYATYA
jgi:hypothetical protein